MKIKYVLLAALLALYGFSYAQVSKEYFDKAVDLVNCKAIELSLKKSPTDGVLAKFQTKCNCEQGSSFKSISEAIPKSETKTIELSLEIDIIKKNEFKENLTPDVVVKILTEEIFLNQTKYKKLFEFESKRKDKSDYIAFKEQLETVIKLLLLEQPQFSTSTSSVAASNASATPGSATQVKIDSLEQRISVLEQHLEGEETGWTDIFTFQIDILTIMISLILMAVLIILIYNNLYDTIKSYVRNKISEVLVNSNKLSTPNNYEINSLRNDISSLKEQINHLSNKIENSKIPLEIVSPQQEQFYNQGTRPPEIKTPIETFFLSTPNLDGSFNESSISSIFKDGASIYKFTKTGNNRAKFQLDERESSVKLALQYPDKNIDPVCDAVNAFNPKAKRILTVESGEAELENDKWIVNKSQKAKIRYES